MSRKVALFVFLAVVGLGALTYLMTAGVPVDELVGTYPVDLDDVEMALVHAADGDCQSASAELAGGLLPTNPGDEFMRKYRAAQAVVEACWDKRGGRPLPSQSPR